MPRFNDRILDWIDRQDPWVLTKKVFVFGVILIAALLALGALAAWIRG